MPRKDYGLVGSGRCPPTIDWAVSVQRLTAPRRAPRALLSVLLFALLLVSVVVKKEAKAGVHDVLTLGGFAPAISADAAGDLGTQALQGILSQLGQLARDTTAAVRRTVHRGLSAARQTEAFKALKYAMNQQPLPTTEAMEESLRQVGRGLAAYLNRVDAVNPAERAQLLSVSLRHSVLVGVLFKYSGLPAFPDADEAYHRLKELTDSLQNALEATKHDSLAAAASNEHLTLPGDRIPKAAGRSEDRRERSNREERGGSGLAGLAHVKAARAERLAVGVLKSFEEEVAMHLSFLAGVLSAHPEDTETLKLYVRRMLFRLKQAFRAAWELASEGLSSHVRRFHLRYLADYLYEFGIVDYQLAKIGAVIPASQPPFDPQNYYYGTPSLDDTEVAQ